MGTEKEKCVPTSQEGVCSTEAEGKSGLAKMGDIVILLGGAKVGNYFQWAGVDFCKSELRLTGRECGVDSRLLGGGFPV